MCAPRPDSCPEKTTPSRGDISSGGGDFYLRTVRSPLYIDPLLAVLSPVDLLDIVVLPVRAPVLALAGVVRRAPTITPRLRPLRPPRPLPASSLLLRPSPAWVSALSTPSAIVLRVGLLGTVVPSSRAVVSPSSGRVHRALGSAAPFPPLHTLRALHLPSLPLRPALCSPPTPSCCQCARRSPRRRDSSVAPSALLLRPAALHFAFASPPSTPLLRLPARPSARPVHLLTSTVPSPAPSRVISSAFAINYRSVWPPHPSLDSSSRHPPAPTLCPCCWYTAMVSIVFSCMHSLSAALFESIIV